MIDFQEDADGKKDAVATPTGAVESDGSIGPAAGRPSLADKPDGSEPVFNTPLPTPPPLTDDERKKIQQLLHKIAAQKRTILPSSDIAAAIEAGTAIDAALEGITIKPNFLLHQIWSPLRYIAIWWKVGRVIKKWPLLFQSKHIAKASLANWLFYLELQLPGKQRKQFRKSIFTEYLYSEVESPIDFLAFMAALSKKKSSWSRLALYEVGVTVMAALQFRAEENLLKSTLYQVVELVNQLGLLQANRTKRWVESTRNEIKDLLGLQAQDRYPSFIIEGKKELALNTLNNQSIVYRLVHHLQPTGAVRMKRVLHFLTSKIEAESLTITLLGQVADLLHDLSVLTDKELARFPAHEQKKRKFSILGKSADILVNIPSEEWSTFIKRDANTYIRGIIWWDGFVPGEVWSSLKESLDNLSSEKRLDNWYIMGHVGSAFLAESPGSDQFKVEAISTICSQQKLPGLYPARLRALMPLDDVVVTYIYARYLPELVTQILRLGELGYRPDDDFLIYILEQDYPLNELRTLTKMLEKFNKNIMLYMETSVRVGRFLNEKLTRRANIRLTQELLKEKMGIMMVFVSIADGLLYEEAVKFIRYPDPYNSEMYQLLDSFTNHERPMTDLVYLLEELRQRKMIDRLVLIRITRLLEMTCQARNITVTSRMQRALRERFTDLVQSLPTSADSEQFVENGLQNMIELVITKDPIQKLDATIAAVKKLKYPDFILRFLLKIAPMIISSFERDLELTHENLQWAVSIYNKNADEEAIMEELEEKMKGQIQSVGKRLGAIPNLIRQLAKGLGAAEDDVQNLVRAMRKISIKFAELEMLAPEQKVGTAKITMQQTRQQTGSVQQIVNRFMREGINNIITALFHYKDAFPFFFDDESGIIRYLDLIMPVDTISQEDVTVALGEKPILFEERGFVFINEILPMSIEAVEGDPDKLRRIFDTIVRAVQREIFTSDLGVRYLKNCANHLRHMSTRYRLAQSASRILEWKPSISIGVYLKELAKDDALFDPQKRFETILHILDQQKDVENTIIKYQKIMQNEIGVITHPANLSKIVVQRMLVNYQTVLSYLTDPAVMEKFTDVYNSSDVHFGRWTAKLPTKDDFIFWLRRMNTGKLTDRLEWMKTTPWYLELKSNYWRESYRNRFFGWIMSLFIKFENLPNHDEIVAAEFSKWIDSNFHLFGRLLLASIALGETMVQPSQLFARCIDRVIPTKVEIQSEFKDARWCFLEESLVHLKNLTVRDKIFSEENRYSLEDRLTKNVIPDINNLAVLTFKTKCIARIPAEYRDRIQTELDRRLDFLQADEERSAADKKFEFLNEYFDHYVFGHIILASVGDPVEEQKIHRVLLEKTWLFGGQDESRTIEQEIDVFQRELLSAMKELWSRQGVLSKEQVAKIEQEMPEEYQESIDALQVLMTWTMDPMKIMLLGEIDEKPTLMKAISQDGVLMSLLDSKAADPRVLPLVQEIGNDPARLKQALQSL